MIWVSDIHAKELEVYSQLNEAQLYHYFEPAPGIFIAESPNVVRRAMAAGYEPISMLMEERFVDGEAADIIAKFENVPVYVAEADVLTKITGFHLTRGLLVAMRRKELLSVESLLAQTKAKRIAVLEDVVNPTNVGAIIRSAAALNMDAVLLTKPCADPLYRRAARVSMGCVFQIPWTYIEETDGESYVEKLRKLGFACAAMALEEDSVSVDDASLNAKDKIAVILGTEGEGLKEETIAACDYTVCIPMAHGVDSLNVAAASAVAFYQLGNREQK